MPGWAVESRIGERVKKEENEKEEGSMLVPRWYRERGALWVHPKFWLDDKIEARIIHWNTQGHAFWAKLDLKTVVWCFPMILMSKNELEGDRRWSALSFIQYFDQDTIFSLLGPPDLESTKTFQIPHHTASWDVFQVPSIQGAVLEEKIARDLEFCLRSFSITS